MNNKPIVVDANVSCQAGKQISLLSPDEILYTLKCNEYIQALIKDPNPRLVLDDGFRILNEYDKVCYVNQRNEPNTTSVFRKWVYQYFAINYCSIDIIHLSELGKNVYQEYPDSPALSTFDPNDRKYIAVANAHNEHPVIINATDTDWWPIRDTLYSIGIIVEFICIHYIQNHQKTS